MGFRKSKELSRRNKDILEEYIRYCKEGKLQDKEIIKRLAKKFYLAERTIENIVSLRNDL